MNSTGNCRSARLFLAAAALALAGCARNDGATARLDYNWDVRPILSNNCFRCHGPDAKAREGIGRAHV